jgi:MoxR-like ATPase
MTSPIRRRLNSYRLVGCDDELDAVLAWASALYAGEPNAVMVFGPAGMGKSRLVEEVNRRLAAEPTHVVVGGRVRHSNPSVSSVPSQDREAVTSLC